MFEHISVEATECDEPYAAQVRRWFLQELPGAVGHVSDNLELIFEAFMANSKIRIGAKPSPEVQVAIRDVIRAYTAQNRPIPVLVPWGSEKPGEGPLDLAEVAGLRALYDLNARVKLHYAPGTEIRVRIEDASAPHLFWQRMEASRIASAEYTHQLATLIHILGAPITAVPESSMVSQEKFERIADPMIPVFEEYLRDTDLYGMKGYENRESYKTLMEIGWKGEIPVEQRNYYRHAYQRLYGWEPTGEKATHTLARYFSGALARYQLRTRGDSEKWDHGFIVVAFIPEVPGAPKAITGTTMFYRTFPENVVSTHIPPWRGHGFLQVTNSDIRPKLLPTYVQLPFHEAKVTICGADGERVEVQADYVIVE